MAEYIEREAFVESQHNIYCVNCDRRKDSKGKFVYFVGDAPCRACGIMDVLDAVEDFPAADVPPALWTDKPISGTEFMTHNQGQSGFEIHFRTDDKAKYEAVQDECRRQIGHAKPAADVRPVVRARWEYNPGDNIPYCSECMMPQDSECNYCPNCGAMMEES